MSCRSRAIRARSSSTTRRAFSAELTSACWARATLVETRRPASNPITATLVTPTTQPARMSDGTFE